MNWLITGGAGYIGSHVVEAMQAAGEEVVVIDDLSTGSRDRVSGVPFVHAEVGDVDAVVAAVQRFGVTGVVHLAAKKQVEESVRRPLYYYQQNVEGLRSVLSACLLTNIETFVFSSSAAVYGAPDAVTVSENTLCEPVNPYGRTKLIGEQMLLDLAEAEALRFVSLRYFNVAGTVRPELADLGSSNLVPMVFDRLEAGSAPLIFGDDYPTPDGTCVRDFIHVGDVASAHVAAASALASGQVERLTANIGRGAGVSVREMIEEILSVTGFADETWAMPEVHPRRLGDPAQVVAAVDRVADAIGWRARHDLKDMVTSSWEARTRSTSVESRMRDAE